MNSTNFDKNKKDGAPQGKYSEEKRKIIREIGKRAIEIRISLRLSQKEVANAVEMPASNLSEMEHGRSAPGFNYLFKFSKRFNVNLNYLLHGTGKMFIPGKHKETPGADGKIPVLTSINTLEDMIWFAERSPLLRNHLIATAATYRYQNEKMIEKDIKVNSQPNDG